MLKKTAGVLHLWLGLAAGLVLVLSLVPAAIFVFDKELTRWWYHKEIYAEQRQTVTLPLSILKRRAQAAIGTTERITEIEIGREANKAYVFTAYRENKHPGLTFFSENEYMKQVYVDPYTGEVQGVIDMTHNWIYLCRIMHQQLLLRYDIGHWLIAMAALIIFIMILTGLILWFPKNKAALRQRFTIKWKSRWRRKNYDVHSVGGFYTHLIIFVLAASGLVWSFDWWQSGIYRLLGDDPTMVFQHARKVPGYPVDNSDLSPLDRAFSDVLSKRASWTIVDLALPGSGEPESDSSLSFFLSFNDHGGWDEGDDYEYDPSTGILLKQSLQQNKTLGEKWRNSNYAIHTGSIYGLPTKMLVCLATLFCASLPITGFMIWWGRKKKSRKK